MLPRFYSIGNGEIPEVKDVMLVLNSALRRNIFQILLNIYVSDLAL